MYKILPHPKVINENTNNQYSFKTLSIKFRGCNTTLIEKIKEIIKIKLSVYPSLDLNFNSNKNAYEDFEININCSLDNYVQSVAKDFENLFKLQGYVIEIKEKKANIYFNNYSGTIYAISTLKQLFNTKSDKPNYYVNELFILDYPEVEKRSISTSGTAWYAGYGRVGFDM